MTEATLQTTDQEQEALIQEMMRGVETHELPGDLSRNPVIHRGDAEQPAPMVVNTISSAGYVYMWDTRTFAKIPVLRYLLEKKLRQRREDGSFRFTTIDPRRPMVQGSIKCILHPDNENRKHFNELGFRSCPKNNITNQYQLERHMALKHKQEWAAITAEKTLRERDEDRKIQQDLARAMGAVISGSTPRPAPISAPPTIVPEPTTPSRLGFICEVCEADFGSQKTLEKHRETQHK
jgi:hypothetical protein